MDTDTSLNEIGVLQRREIEARILAPVLDALAQVFGKEAVLEITRRTIADIARRQGRELAEQLGRNDLEAYSESLEPWTRNGALELRILNQNQTHLDFDVTHCRYAQLYHKLGLAELGSILSCNRDASFIEGFNSAIHLDRTQTIMQGAPHCDFQFSKRDSG
jgi:predicted ArsR family transcriptional regulator